MSSIPGESPPPAPRACFGRGELIEEVVGLAENLNPIALIGTGGIGKTAIALTVLHHDRIKRRFGGNRWFIRCDQFPASRTHFLSRLSKVIGAGIENPADLTHLRPFLSSKEMIIVLDNAESILDPQGTGAREIYTVAEELGQFNNVCLCITSRISTVPRHCKRPIISTLSVESACDIFYGIHDNGNRSDIITNLLRRLDFHALSITLLATMASHNMWDYDRVSQEWDAHHVQVLRTDYNESLAATIELSLASPTFRELGPDARDLLGVIAFFPQGIDEKNLNWLFSTIPNRRNIFDKFCALSLTYRSNGFTTMLAPLRDYLYPNPTSSPLLQSTKEHYFGRVSVVLDPNKPGFREAQWITSEDVNVEHLLDVFTTVDANSNNVWNACCCFMEHLYTHKPRLVMLKPKIEGLPDDHRLKPECLFQLSQLFHTVGNQVERKQLLTHALKLWRGWGDDFGVALVLGFLSDASLWLGLCEEGIRQAKEALEIYKRLNDRPRQAQSWQRLASLLTNDGRLDAAEDAVSQALNLLPGEGDQFGVCKCHRLLGSIYLSKGETKKAINRFETALGMASSFNWDNEQFWNHLSLAWLFLGEGRFDDAHAHVERAKSHAINDTYNLGRAMELQAIVWCKECRFEDAKSEALRSADVYAKLGVVKDLERCKALLQDMEGETKELVTPGESLETVLPPVC